MIATEAKVDIPAIDTLSITVVVDSHFDGLAPDEEHAGLSVQRGRGKLLGQHGLSLYVQTTCGDQTRRCLLDFGMTQDVLFPNIELLELDLSGLDALILSHGHVDHFGGLAPLLARYRERMPKDLPIYVGGEDVFCHRWHLLAGGKRRSYGVLDRRELERANLRVVMTEQPAIVADHIFTSGTIPRTSFENVIPNTYAELGVRGGLGCCGANLRGFFSEEQLSSGELMFDNHWGEHATAFNLKDRGLVVITSCGHAGVINSVRQAQAVSGVGKVHAVVGGFHLSPARKDYVAQVVACLKQEIDMDYVIPMHCTGATFAHLAAHEMPEKLVMSYVGSRFTFSADGRVVQQ